MARTGTINLISTNIEYTPEFSGLYGTLRRISYGSLILFIVLGVIVGGIAAYLSARENNLTAQKDALTATMNQVSVKEGLLLTVRQRVSVIDKITLSQKQIAPLFTAIDNILSGGQLISLSLDEVGQTVLTAHVNTLENAISLVDSLLASSQSKALTKPALTSFTIAKDGGFDIAVSFVPKL